MKSLQLHRLCKKTATLFFCQEIHTGRALQGRGRGKVPPIINYEPGTKHRDSFFKEDPISQSLPEEVEDDVDPAEDLDFMNVDLAYDEDKREQVRRREKLRQIITYKKFFSPRPQPAMLTCNERECIKYLHKQDPVQWSVKSLSESFPATPDAVSKVLRSNWKISPEKARKIDSKVQKNWELLEKGELDADPVAIKHFKKFINRKEVLLEQIKKEKFYLPELKKEPVWNNGELAEILNKYEKQIKQLAESADEYKQPKQLKSGIPKEKSLIHNEISLDVLHKNIEEVACKRDPEVKDSFTLGKMLNYYAEEKTLDRLEREILEKAVRKKKLGTIERVILKTNLGVTNQNYVDVPESTSSPTNGVQEKVEQSLDMIKKESRKISREARNGQRMVPNSVKIKYISEKEDIIEDDGTHPVHEMNVKKQGNMKESLNFDGTEIRKSNSEVRYNRRMAPNSMKMESEYPPEEEEDLKVDGGILQAYETNVGKLLNKPNNETKPEEVMPKKENEVKKEINFSDPESIASEKAFYDREVENIKNTSFWNNGRSSKDKALAESLKPSNDALALGSCAVNMANTPVFSTESYPERIKIPKNQRGSGLTFRVKDCYYDDDGQFLYRVPGMIK